MTTTSEIEDYVSRVLAQTYIAPMPEDDFQDDDEDALLYGNYVSQFFLQVFEVITIPGRVGSHSPQCACNGGCCTVLRLSEFFRPMGNKGSVSGSGGYIVSFEVPSADAIMAFCSNRSKEAVLKAWHWVANSAVVHLDSGFAKIVIRPTMSSGELRILDNDFKDGLLSKVVRDIVGDNVPTDVRLWVDEDGVNVENSRAARTVEDQISVSRDTSIPPVCVKIPCETSVSSSHDALIPPGTVCSENELKTFSVDLCPLVAEKPSCLKDGVFHVRGSDDQCPDIFCPMWRGEGLLDDPELVGKFERPGAMPFISPTPLGEISLGMRGISEIGCLLSRSKGYGKSQPRNYDFDSVLGIISESQLCIPDPISKTTADVRDSWREMTNEILKMVYGPIPQSGLDVKPGGNATVGGISNLIHSSLEAVPVNGNCCIDTSICDFKEFLQQDKTLHCVPQREHYVVWIGSYNISGYDEQINSLSTWQTDLSSKELNRRVSNLYRRGVNTSLRDGKFEYHELCDMAHMGITPGEYMTIIFNLNSTGPKHERLGNFPHCFVEDFDNGNGNMRKMVVVPPHQTCEIFIKYRGKVINVYPTPEHEMQQAREYFRGAVNK